MVVRSARQIQALEKAFLTSGGLSEAMTRARLARPKPVNPLFPALRSGPTAGSGASLKTKLLQPKSRARPGKLIDENQ